MNTIIKKEYQIAKQLTDVTYYVADDGKEFKKAEDCIAYESNCKSKLDIESKYGITRILNTNDIYEYLENTYEDSRYFLVNSIKNIDEFKNDLKIFFPGDFANIGAEYYDYDENDIDGLNILILQYDDNYNSLCIKIVSIAELKEVLNKYIAALKIYE